MGAACCCCCGKKPVKADIIQKPQFQKPENLVPVPPPEPKPEPKPEPIPEPVVEKKVEIIEEKPKEVEAVDLLLTKKVETPKQEPILEPPPEPTQAEIDDEYFEKEIKLQKVDFKQQQNIKNQWSIAKYLQSENKSELINPSNHAGDVIGPKVINRRLPSLENKYDFSGTKDFSEYSGEIKLLRLIEKPENSTCSYIGKIEGKLCCVKLIPMVKITQITQWIIRVGQAQKDTSNFFQQHFQKYYFYQIQRFDQDQTICNLFIITTLDQYNAYTFSVDPTITLEDKVKVAYDIIQVIELVLTTKYQSKHEVRQTSVKDVYKNIETIKRNNLLISQQKLGDRNVFMVRLADWQLLLDEFQSIIPKESIQRADNYIDLVQELQFTRTMNALERSGNLSKEQQKIYDDKRDKNKQIVRTLVEDYTRNVLSLIFFKVNYDMLQEFKLDDFIDKQTYEYILKEIQNQKTIQDQAKNKEQGKRIMADFIHSKFQLPQKQNKLELVNIYEILMLAECEKMRGAFDDLFKFINN